VGTGPSVRADGFRTAALETIVQRERRPAGAAKHARGRADPRLARQEGLAPPSDARCVNATPPRPHPPSAPGTPIPRRDRSTQARGEGWERYWGCETCDAAPTALRMMSVLVPAWDDLPAAMPPVSLWLRIHAMPQHASCGTTMRHHPVCATHVAMRDSTQEGLWELGSPLGLCRTGHV